MFPNLVRALLLTYVFSSFGFVAATLISSSQLSRCVDSGAAEGISCTQKFVVAISLDGGQNGTESVMYWTSAATAEGQTAHLSSPVKLTVRKSKPFTRYPIFYWQNVNAKPIESTIYTTALKCDDSSSSSTPTCGRAFSSGGSPIAFSEGYCCDCSLCELIGFCSSGSRANTHCSLFGDGAAASCLSFGPRWYSGFSIGSAQTYYAITVTISVHGQPDVSLVVGPTNLGAVDAQRAVAVRLVGDFAPFEAPLDLTNKYMFVPYGPSGDPRVTAPAPQEWMLVDRSLVTADGSECNKIGVSYNGFNGQGSRCSLNVGSCTANQIEDLRASDLALMGSNRKGQYMASNFGDFAAYDDVMNPVSTSRRSFLEQDTSTSNQYYLAYVVNQVQASLITITLSADNISYTVNLSPGRIIQANLSSSFAASSRDGFLSVTIMNIGSIVADYQVSVTRCTAGTFPIDAKLASISPLQIASLTFNVFFQILGGSVDSSCNVTLYDSQFQVTDFVVVHFNTSAVNISAGVQSGDRSPPGSDIVNGRPDSSGDCASCPWYNPMCFLSKSCFWQMLLQLASCILGVFFIATLIKHANLICGLCGGGKSSEEKKRRRRREPV